MITFIRMWQSVLNQLNIARFEFNMYTISILVIFFLQMEHKFPTTDQTPANVCSKVSNFRLILKEFFNLYGSRYQMWNHVISTRIGRWQERRIQAKQTYFTPAQKRFVVFNVIKSQKANFQWILLKFLIPDYAQELQEVQKIGKTVQCMCRT